MVRGILKFRFAHVAWVLAGLAVALPGQALATVWTVGPHGRQFAQLSELFRSENLAPGDVVSVDGGATYAGGIVVGDDDGGEPGMPVLIRWNGSGGSRPLLAGGGHTIKLEQSNHVVLQGLEISGGTRSCLFSEADDVIVRDVVIHDCPAHGILGADRNSGSFTLEDSELYRIGSGTTKHAIYMQSDEVAYPNAVFTMRHNYVHDGTGGVLVRVRHQRSRIYYNWIEASKYGELELIGPDCETQADSWNADRWREDADVVGNVIVHTNPRWKNAIRAGGDLNGRSQGRVRLVNNTIVFTNAGPANAVMVQLGLGSLEMHNNVVYQAEQGSAPAIVRENPAKEVDTPFCGPPSREPWTAGRKVAGSHNWVQSGATLVPPEWTQTIRGDNPGFADVASLQLWPRADSPLVDAGNDAPAAPVDFPYPTPLALPEFEPPLRTKTAFGTHRDRRIVGTHVDIGAFELAPRREVDVSAPTSMPMPGITSDIVRWLDDLLRRWLNG